MGSTIVFDGNPDPNTAIGMDGEQRMSARMIEANSTINNDVSARHTIPGQVQRRRPMAPSAPVQQPQMPPPQPMQYQQPYPQYQQYPAYQQPQYPQYQQPVQQQYAQPAQQGGDDAASDEPYSELILVNDVYHCYFDLPGVKKSSLAVKYVNGQLEIGGTRTSKLDEWKGKLKGNKGKKPVLESQVTVPDYLFGKFKFSFYLPLPVDEDTIKADMDEGILHVSMQLRSSSGGVSVSVQ